jgi:sugar phosphate permease
MAQTKTTPATSVTSGAAGHLSAYMWVVLFASLLVQTTASFGNQSISPLAPFLLADLRLSKVELGLVVSAFYLGAVLMLTPAGWASDRLGVRRMFLFGLLGVGVPLLLAAQVGLLPLLMGTMLLSGVGNAVALPPTTRAITYWFPPRLRGTAMGIKQTGVALAGVIMGLVVPRLAEPLGWRGTLSSIGWFTVAAGLLAWLLYREHPEAHAAQTQNRVQGGGFRALLANRNLMLLCATSIFLAAAQLSLINFMVLFLKERLGYEAAAAGGLLALAQSGGVVGRIGWGVVSDAFFGGRRRVIMAIIAAGSALSAFALAQIGPGVSEQLLWLLLVITGLTAVGWNGINMTFVAEVAGRRASATAAGLNLTGSYIRVLFGPPLIGWLVDHYSYVSAFLVAGVLGLVALALILQIRPAAPDD